MPKQYQWEGAEAFERALLAEEKAPLTRQKYLHDVDVFWTFRKMLLEGGEGPLFREGAGERKAPALEKPEETAPFMLRTEEVLCYKRCLLAHYRTSSAASMLNSLNRYLCFLGRGELCVRMPRQQRRLFCDERRKLRRTDYERLVRQAELEKKERLSCILQTLCMTGIRIGELSQVRVSCLKTQLIRIEWKGKIREIVMPKALVRLLSAYCKKRGITEGAVFVTRGRKPVDRKNIWREMKNLCKRADIDAEKVFPHNFRHLFADSYYEKTKDLVRLADYLGHSSLETTRRYTAMSTLDACQRELDLGLLVTGEPCGKRAK